MSNAKAEALPAGSIVGNDTAALFRTANGIGSVWHSTRNGRRHNDAEVQQMLDTGAQVLRSGY